MPNSLSLSTYWRKRIRQVRDAGFRATSKYVPHQGKREIARRQRQQG